MKKYLLIFPILIVLLSGCNKNDIYGSWEVVDNKNGECPVYYKFETVVKKENKEEIVQNLVEMQTTNKKKIYIKVHLSKILMYITLIMATHLHQIKL